MAITMMLSKLEVDDRLDTQNRVKKFKISTRIYSVPFIEHCPLLVISKFRCHSTTPLRS